jgi:hypothetical protein
MIEVCSFKSINALTGAKRRLALKKNTKTTRPRKNAAQKTATTMSPRRTVGIDLGDQTSHYCILDEQGDVVSEGTVRTTESGLEEQFRRMAHARIVLEVWLRRGAIGPQGQAHNPLVVFKWGSSLNKMTTGQLLVCRDLVVWPLTTYS